MSKHEAYALPVIPYSAIDMVNRRAAATGSVSYAMATASANYNGHYVTVSYKPHAVSGATWNAEYHWGERVVLGRGSFAHCIERAKAYYDRGDKGAQVVVAISQEAPETPDEQKALCLSLGMEAYTYSNGMDKTRPAFWTAKHEAVLDAFGWEKHFPEVMHAAIQFEGTAEEWPAVREATLKRRREGNKVYKVA